MNCNPFDKTEPGEVTEDDFEAALRTVSLAPRGSIGSENREPTKAEIEARWRLDWKPR